MSFPTALTPLQCYLADEVISEILLEEAVDAVIAVSNGSDSVAVHRSIERLRAIKAMLDAHRLTRPLTPSSN